MQGVSNLAFHDHGLHWGGWPVLSLTALPSTELKNPVFSSGQISSFDIIVDLSDGKKTDEQINNADSLFQKCDVLTHVFSVDVCSLVQEQFGQS